MIDRVGNFPPGPGALPLPVLEHGRDELMVELAGHRSMGEVRASIYNAVPRGGGASAPVVHGALPHRYPLTMQVSVRFSPGSSWMSLSI